MCVEYYKKQQQYQHEKFAHNLPQFSSKYDYFEAPLLQEIFQ